MNIGILLAAGKSARFNGDKLFSHIDGKPVIYHSLKLLEDSSEIKMIFIGVNKKNKKRIEELVKKERFRKVKKIILGGNSRFDSVSKLLTCTLAHLPVPLWRWHTCHYLIIHNAANPFAQAEELKRCLNFLIKHKDISGIAPGNKAVSTLKKLDKKNNVITTIERKNIWEAQTPQIVRTGDFLTAIKKIHSNKPTDDLAVLETAGFKTALISASPRNKKITFPTDLPEEYRVGIGEDSHWFERSNMKDQMSKIGCLILGGVKIKNLPKLDADSDGDVIIHALCNAIAGAIGEKSLGTYATKMRKQGIHDSKKYLEKILQKMEEKGLKINNCSISIEAAKPKIDSVAHRIKENLGKILGISKEQIGITATSGEKLTSFGKGKGIRCLASVLLQKNKRFKIFPK